MLVNLIFSIQPNSHHLNSLICMAKDLLLQFWLVRLTHTYEEENSVANRLAHMSLILSLGNLFFIIAPLECLSCLWIDFIGVSWPRSLLV